MKKIWAHYRLSKGLHRRVKSLAKRTKRTLTDIGAEAIEIYLNQPEQRQYLKRKKRVSK
jgi:predicted DNA-binding protein